MTVPSAALLPYGFVCSEYRNRNLFCTPAFFGNGRQNPNGSFVATLRSSFGSLLKIFLQRRGGSDAAKAKRFSFLPLYIDRSNPGQHAIAQHFFVIAIFTTLRQGLFSFVCSPARALRSALLMTALRAFVFSAVWYLFSFLKSAFASP